MGRETGNFDTVCRPCGSVRAGGARCQECGSTRFVRHAQIASLSIAHLDCDAFYAAIEKRDRPDIRNRPVIIGGGTRGVVATACYMARMHGVRSAMPMFKALKACPDAVVIKPDFPKYAEAGRLIRERMLALTPLVEPVSIDEAYIDLSGTERLHGAAPASLLARLQGEIETEIGLSVSIGLSTNKFLAKTASELDKPRGFAAIAQEDAPALLRDQPASYLHGVGAQLAARLARDGFETVGTLQAADANHLVRLYGETGLFLHERAFGRDSRPVSPDRERKSVSSETTFDTDLADPEALEDLLWHVCVRTADRAKLASTEGRVITLKLKTKGFRSITRRASLPEPTQLARAIFDATRPMLDRELGSGPFRLIGVGLSELTDARGDRPDLIDQTRTKRAAAERASDLARSRFGQSAVQTGRALKRDRTRKPRS